MSDLSLPKWIRETFFGEGSPQPLPPIPTRPNEYGGGTTKPCLGARRQQRRRQRKIAHESRRRNRVAR